MDGVITSVSSSAVTILVDVVSGAGTYATWNIGVTGAKGVDGVDGEDPPVSIDGFTTAIATTASLANNAAENLDLNLGGAGVTASIAITRSSIVRLYSTSATRAADTRTATDPLPAAVPDGLISEIYFSAAETRYQSIPYANGSDGELIYARVFNTSGVTGTVGLTIVFKPQAYFIQYFDSAEKTANFTALKSTRYPVDTVTNSAAITVTMPASGRVAFYDSGGNRNQWNGGWTVYNVILTPVGGSTIEGLATFPLDVSGAHVELELFGTNWKVREL
jgi:hypothetical protein